MSWLKRLLTPPLLVIAALLMWVEDSLWQWLKQFTAWVAIFPVVRRLETLLAQLPPYAAIAVFLLPTMLLLPVKLLAVYWITRGYWLASFTLLAAAKVFGTAVVARMYVVCHPNLMSIDWFRRVHDWLLTTRDALYSAIRTMPIFQMLNAKLSAIKLAVRAALIGMQGRRGLWVRWRAIRRWSRHRSHRAIRGRR